MDKKVQKKIERDRAKRKVLLRRREKLRVEAKVEAAKVREEFENNKVINRHTKTINYAQNGKLTDEEIKSRLEHNLEILKALEAEYEAEQKLRADNSKHAPEMLEKFKQQQEELMHQLTVAPEPTDRNLGGEAEVSFKPNLPEAIGA